jgi:peroxiredoxin
MVVMENVNVLRTGFLAPDFSLPDTMGEIFHLKDNLAETFLCLCFLPDLDSEKTIAYIKDLNQGLPNTASGLPVKVIGISSARVGHLKAFKDKLKLNSPILSDSSLSVSAKYYIVNSYSHKATVYFSLFIIDDSGIIRYRASEVPGVSRYSPEELKTEIPKLL